MHMRLEEVAGSAHLHLYAPSSTQLATWQARQLVTAFEMRIFPTDTRLFGYPPRMAPVDVALVPLDTMTLGYFDQNDVDPSGPGGDSVHSNRANVLFARLPNAMPDRNKLADTEEVLAHELQHLIEYRARVLQHHLAPEESWLNEGLSFYAQLASGYWTPRDVLKLDAACGTPTWPVTSLSQTGSFLSHSARIAYGRAGLFVVYLAGRFGPRIAHELIGSPATGMAAVDIAVRGLNPRESAQSVFADWGVAQYLHARGIYGYGVYARNLTATPSLTWPAVSAFPFDSHGLATPAFTLKPWGQAYYQLATRGGENLQVRVDAPAGTIRAAAIMEDTTHFAQPTVRWLQPGADGSMLFRLNRLGDLYDRVTLSVSYEPRTLADGGPPVRIRLRASLVNVSDHD
jgi:hypothetical protein